MSLSRSVVLVLAFVLVLAACEARDADPLAGRTFIGTTVVEDGEDRPLVAGTEISIAFRDGQVSASAGCNIFGGAYRIENGRLVVDGGSMTEMGCDDERSAQDEWVFAFLAAQPELRRTDNELELSTDGTVVTLIDREIAQPRP